MNIEDYIKWLRKNYGDAQISFTGMPIKPGDDKLVGSPFPPEAYIDMPRQEPTETDRVVELGKILGRKLEEFEYRLNKTAEDISILYGLYEKKRKKQVRPRGRSKSKGKGKVRTLRKAR